MQYAYGMYVAMCLYVPYSGKFSKTSVNMVSKKYFRKILQTMHDKVYDYISYLAISKKYFRKCSKIKPFENFPLFGI